MPLVLVKHMSRSTQWPTRILIPTRSEHYPRMLRFGLERRLQVFVAHQIITTIEGTKTQTLVEAFVGGVKAIALIAEVSMEIQMAITSIETSLVQPWAATWAPVTALQWGVSLTTRWVASSQVVASTEAVWWVVCEVVGLILSPSSVPP